MANTAEPQQLQNRGTQPIIHQVRTGGRGLNGDKYGKAASAVPCTQWGCEDRGAAGSAGFFLQRLRGPELGAPPPPGSSSASVRPARRRFVRGRAGGRTGRPGSRGTAARAGGRRPAGRRARRLGPRARQTPPPRLALQLRPLSPAGRGPPGLSLLPAAAARRPRVPGSCAEARARRPGRLWRAGRPAGPRAPGAGRPRAPGRPGPPRAPRPQSPALPPPPRGPPPPPPTAPVGAAEGGSAAPRSAPPPRHSRSRGPTALPTLARELRKGTVSANNKRMHFPAPGMWQSPARVSASLLTDVGPFLRRLHGAGNGTPSYS
ncbi:hypothetical protein ACRRTK_021429 [Alexandromys fortis]